jgi:hypothetical protein
VSRYKVNEYRQWTAECLSFAAKAEREEDKRTWLGLASKWERLANEAAWRGQQAQQPQPQQKP